LDWAAAFGVELDHIFKRRHTAVMHVRRGARDLAQRRRLERAVVARIAGDREPAFSARRPSRQATPVLWNCSSVKFGPI
jgi:hypothetical protein